MSCPANSFHGFVKFKIPNFTRDVLKTINPSPSDGKAPFIINYQPRSTPISILVDSSSNRIIEDPQNTLLFKGITYTLTSVQLCNARNYIVQGTTENPVESTLIFTFISQYMTTVKSDAINAVKRGTAIPNSVQSTGGTPLVIILIIPIFYTNSTNPTYNDAYLKQLINSDATTSSYKNMKDVLTNQQSIMNGACFDILLESSYAFGISANIYNFMPGIIIDSRDFTAIASKYKMQNFNYVFDYGHIITNYSSGIPDINQTSPVIPIVENAPNVTDSAFINKFVYYSNDVATSSRPVEHTPEQYQCFPFNELNNLYSDSKGVQKVSLKEIINKNSTSDSIPNTMTVWQIVAICLIVLIVLLAIIGFYLWRTSISPPIPTGGAAATTAATTPAP